MMRRSIPSYSTVVVQEQEEREVSVPKKSSTVEMRKSFFDVVLVILFSCLTISAYFYLLSLKGGTFQYMKDHLTQFVLVTLTSIGIYIATFNAILFLPQLTRTKRCVCIVIWMAYILFIYWWDHEDSMEHHGYFNFIGFLLVFGYSQLFISLIFVLVKLWKMIPNKMRKIFLIISVVASLATLLRASMWYGRRVQNFRKGLFGENMLLANESTSICHLNENAIPWHDIVPPYLQNFWMGQWFGCPSVSFTPNIRLIDGNSKMEIYCPYSSDVHIQIIPNSIGWSFTEKYRLQNHLLKRITEKKLKCHPERKIAILDLNEEGIYPHEAFRISCSSTFVEKHSRIIFYPRRKEEVVQRVKRIREEKGLNNVEQSNIMVLFFDAVSRKHFQRKFPKTIKVMESIQKDYMENLNTKKSSTGIFQFFRYHALDFSTDDNTRAMWTGRTKFSTPPEEFKNVFANATVRPPIWHLFRDNGYVTARIDDFCEDWSARYVYYVADHDHEAITPFCLPEYHLVNRTNDLINGPYGIRHRCLSGRFVHTYSFEYIKQFWDVYLDIPKFVVSAFIEGHELTGEIIQDVDDDLANFISYMKSKGYMDNTILVLLSDHGLHCGFLPILTESGKIEHMNPLQYWLIPNSILQKYEELGMRRNLIANSQRLITSFDIYETLKHTLNLTQTPVYLNENKPPYGRSLFTDKISRLRTCDDVHIPPKYCKCIYKT